MINIFQASANDQSLFYLGQIFGYVGNVLPTQAGGSLLLGTMFKTFNSVVLAVGALMVVYITIVGVMATAHEGEFLGKKWHSLWVPIRTVLGIAALVPTPSGYSSIQIIMMWIIVQGIGAADNIWNTVLNYVTATGSPYASVTIPSVSVNDTMKTLFQSLVCQASAQATHANPLGTDVTKGGYFCASNPSNPVCQSTGFNPGAGRTTYDMGLCGSLSYCDVSTLCADQTNVGKLACTACQAQISALQSIIPTLQSIAQEFVTRDYAYRVFYATNDATPEGGVQAYCSANNVPTKSCCLTSPPSALSMITAPGKTQSSCSIRGQAGALPPADFSGSSGADPANANTDFVKKVLWPYDIQTYVSGTDFIQASVGAYIGAIVQAITNQLVQNVKTLPPQLQEAKNFGWIYAGAYYYTIAKMNDTSQEKSTPNFQMGGDNPGTSSSSPLNDYRNNYSAAGQLLQAMEGEEGMGASIPALGGVGSALNAAASGITDLFMDVITGKKTSATGLRTDPLVALHHLGRGILITIEVLFAVIMIGGFILAIFGYINVFVLGTGVVNPVGPAISTIFMFVFPVILGFMGVFMSFGGLLAVYTPLIPYIIFTFAAIGWLIAVIEAMVAAPLVALGILGPGGEHEILGKAAPALMLIFGIFLRPGLMIFGMMAAMLLSVAVVTMINATFKGVMSQISSDPDLLELIFFLAAYVMLIITALNKCFALIHLVPDRVLRWIGGGVEETGAGEALGEIKGGMAAAGGAAAGAAVAAGGMPEKGMEAARARKGAALQKKEPTVTGKPAT